MRYLLLCCIDEKRWEEIPGPQRDRIMQDYGNLLRGLDQSGQHVASAQLLPSSAATTVFGNNGKVSTTDGPFAETKEQLGGFYLINARDLNEAIQIAAKIPSSKTGTVEVRPVVEFDAPS